MEARDAIQELCADAVLTVARGLLPLQATPRFTGFCRLWASTMRDPDMWRTWMLLHFPAAAELLDLPGVHPKWLYLRCFEAFNTYKCDALWQSYGRPSPRDVRFLVRIDRISDME